MKQLILSLLLAVCTACAAQTTHMKFKGIPIEGTLDSFVKKLRDKGYAYSGMQDGMAILEGEFAMTTGCTIAVSRFSDHDQVNLVSVVFPGKETWHSIYTQYSTLKEMLSEKYGEPESIEQFTSQGLSDYIKFHQIKNDEGHCVSTFTTENGKVVLMMAKSDYTSLSVILSYFDNDHTAETRQRIMDDL